MNSSNWEVLNALLHHFHKDDVQSAFKFFPKEQAIHLENLRPPIEPSSIEFPPLSDMVHDIHYSWFFPVLQNLNSKLLPFYLSSFSETYITSLQKMMKKKVKTKKLHKKIKCFFLNKICQEVGLQYILPKNYLPQSEYIVLLKLSKIQLVKLIDFLGLHDLGRALSQVVDKRILEKVLKLLSPEQCFCLKHYIQKKPQLTALSQIDLSQCLSKKNLSINIHKKGIQRFSKALAGQNENLIWHISHKLDTGRGEILLKLSRHKEPTKNTVLLMEQVLHLLEMFKIKGA